MAYRKSKQIGNVIKDFLILDSRKIPNDTQYYVRCQTCGYEDWKSRGFIKAKAICPKCQNGINSRNAKGYTHERLYERYWSILRRVYSPDKYIGVTICKEWENNYLAFREWALSHGYDDSLTIDRIDNSKGYSPDNCRWVTAKAQANNRTSNVIIEYQGEKYTLTQFAEYVDIPVTAMKQRYKYGWSVDDMAKTPYKSRKKWSEMQSN